MTSVLSTVRLPLPWDEFALPNPLAVSGATLTTGKPAWRWDDTAPDLGIPACDAADGQPADGWALDHVVVLVPDLEETVAAFTAIGQQPRLRLSVGGRPTAFFKAGVRIEVVESPVRSPALFGVSLVTEDPLETLVLKWRAMGLDVGDPKPAVQPGRRIMIVRSVEAGFAVMSPDRAN